MDVYQLRTFIAVANAGNITKAAESLYLTQPAVSRQIQSLESGLGVTLFDRTGRGMQLTDAGVVLRDYADRILALTEDCREAMKELQTGVAGKITVGVGGTHSMYELPKWISDFTQRHSAVDVSIRTGRSSEIISAILERELYLAFVRVTVAVPEISCIDLYEEAILLAAPASRYRCGAVLAPADLASAQLILFPRGTSFRAEIDAALKALGIVPRVRMETDSVEEIRRFAAMGLGLSFLPASSIQSDLANGQLVEVSVANMQPLTRRTSLIYRSDRYHSAAMRSFVSLITGREPNL